LHAEGCSFTTQSVGIGIGCINATKVRHYLSTRYAALEVPEQQQDYFYKHIGHSSSTNANIYQAPLAVAEMLQVGSVLHCIF